MLPSQLLGLGLWRDGGIKVCWQRLRPTLRAHGAGSIAGRGSSFWNELVQPGHHQDQPDPEHEVHGPKCKLEYGIDDRPNNAASMLGRFTVGLHDPAQFGVRRAYRKRDQNH